MARKISAASVRNKAKANLISGPTLSTTAPTISAPVSTAPRPVQRANGDLPAPVEVGTQNRGSGSMGINTVPTENRMMAVRQDGSGNWVVGNNRYNQATVEAIVKRGDSGASLSGAQRAIYENYLHEKRGVKTEKEQATADAAEVAEAKRKADMDDWKTKNEIENKQKQAAAELLAKQNKEKADADRAAADARAANRLESEASIREADRNSREKIAADELARKQGIEDAKREKENALAEQFNERYGIETGTRLTKKEQDAIADGTSSWRYSDNDQRTLDGMIADLDEKKRSGILSPDEIAAAEGEIETFKSGLKKGVYANNDERTAEQLYRGTFEIDGSRYQRDKDGKLILLDTAQNPEMKRQQALEDAETKAINKRTEDLMKETDIIDDSGVSTGKKPGLSYEDAYAQAQSEAEIRKNWAARKQGMNLVKDMGITPQSVLGLGGSAPAAKTSVVGASGAEYDKNKYL